LKDSDHLLLLLSPASIKSHWVFIELGGAKALGKQVILMLFHIGANEIPLAISQFLTRNINDFDKYLDEISNNKISAREGNTTSLKKSDNAHPIIREGKFGIHSIGDEVTIASVEHLTDEDKSVASKWVLRMDKYSGLKEKIVGVFPSGKVVKLDVDNEEFWWSGTWLSRNV
jgi:hypothetical protein